MNYAQFALLHLKLSEQGRPITKCLDSILTRYSGNAKHMPIKWSMQEDVSVIPGFPSRSPVFLKSLLEADDVDAATTQRYVADICGGMLDVLERQMAAQLPGGASAAPPTEQSRQRASHSRLTNLHAEHNFGDLDYQMRQKPNATLRHHSGLVMLKRNKTMEWLQMKDPADKATLLQDARKKAPVLRKEEQQIERDVMTTRKEMLKEARNKKIKAIEKEEKNKDVISRAVAQQGGPCTSVSDVDRLLERITGLGKKRLALGNELNYQRAFQYNAEHRDLYTKSTKGKLCSIDELRNKMYQLLSLVAAPSVSAHESIVVDVSEE
jgi:hypothetical protein